MKFVIALLALLLGLLQYELWFAHGGLVFAYHLRQGLVRQHALNDKLQARNVAMAANIEDLKNGTDAIEEHARYDLGMIKPTEVFYQLVPE